MNRRAAILGILSLPLALAAYPDDLLDEMNRFAEPYNRLVPKVASGIVDVKLAKEVSGRFHTVERNEEWPK